LEACICLACRRLPSLPCRRFPNLLAAAQWAGLEAGDTAGLETSGTGLQIITNLVRIASFFGIFASSITFFFWLN
jgi:hypothetical protein